MKSVPNTAEWCLEWEVTQHTASRWDQIRHAIAEFIRADEFYEGSGYECDDGVHDTFRLHWTEEKCLKKNPDHVDRFLPLGDWLPRLRSVDTPLVKLISTPDPPGSVIRWNWGTLTPSETSTPPPSDGSPVDP